MIGQINRGSLPGDTITEICGREEVSTIVEIGTWNGCGSTRCITEGITGRDDVEFYSLECDRDQHNLAVSLNSADPRVNFLLGKIVEEIDLDTKNLSDGEAGWLKDDIKAMKEVPNVLGQLPSKIDFLLLDGGEFSTTAELAKLINRSAYIFLDDITLRKNKKNYEILRVSPDFDLITAHPNDRHGWAVFKRTSLNILQTNQFSHLHDGERIFFCKTDFLGAAFKQLGKLPYDVILITGNSDYEINDSLVSAAPQNIKYWFAQNANSNSIYGVPMGIESTIPCKLEGHGIVWSHAPAKEGALRSYAEKPSPTKSFYANFAVSTNVEVRSKVRDLCISNSGITSSIVQNGDEAKGRSYINYLEEIRNHKMVICPEGNGIDCHRVWEALCAGSIPVVKRSTVMGHFEDLPIVYVENWDEISDCSHLLKLYESVKNNSREKLEFKYWKNLILSLKERL